MVPRFSLFGDATQWNGNIGEDVRGRWVRWNDVLPYMTYAVENGYVAPVDEDLPIPVAYMADKTTSGPDPDDEIDMDPNNEPDVYEVIMGRTLSTNDDLD